MLTHIFDSDRFKIWISDIADCEKGSNTTIAVPVQAYMRLHYCQLSL